MGNPGISDEELIKTWRAYKSNGESWMAASAELKISDSAFGHRLKLIRERGLNLPIGARQSIERAGLDAPTARGGWKHIYDDEGKKVETINWRAPATEAEVIDVAAQMRAAFEGIKPAPIAPAPERTISNLCTLYPLMDVHLGMLAWGPETGDDDYDVRHATQDLRRAFSKVIATTPQSEQAVLLIGGDFFHADDNRAETPQSRHRLDVDGRHFKVLGAGVQILSDVIETLARKHERLRVRILRGNHDEHSHLVLTFALGERYRTHDRIEVERDPRDLFLFPWGRSLISAHHGDKGKPEQLVMAIADTCPEFSATRHRWIFTGHTHHDRGRDIGPMKWESLRAFAPKDAYAAGMGYTGRRSLQSLTFDKQDGLVNRSYDPVERTA